jgi:peptidoglycan hydrolase-like protein with peptidoglycan-binding domain
MSTRTAPDDTTAAPVEGASTPPGPHRTRRRRRVWGVALLATAVALGSVVGLALWRGRPVDAATAAAPALPTAEVQRGTLTAAESRDATLAYADTSTLTADVVGRVTWLPATGRERTRGRTLARVDEQRVIAMYGPIPAFRTMALGDTGRDVSQLEENLAELGYSGFTADDTFTSATASAVRAWQADTGLPETGAVQLGQVVFLPGPVQVGPMIASVGDRVSPGTPLYTISTSGRVVSATLDETDRDLAVVGAPVTIDAGSAGVAEGTISRVETITSTSGQGNQPSTSYVATIEIDADSDGAEEVAAQADGSPVSVELAGRTAEDVLSVPVTALLALAEGGYGLEVVDSDSSTRIIAVTPGLFADGRVEVAAEGLAEGMTVVTAR